MVTPGISIPAILVLTIIGGLLVIPGRRLIAMLPETLCRHIFAAALFGSLFAYGFYASCYAGWFDAPKSPVGTFIEWIFDYQHP